MEGNNPVVRPPCTINHPIYITEHYTHTHIHIHTGIPTVLDGKTVTEYYLNPVHIDGILIEVCNIRGEDHSVPVQQARITYTFQPEPTE